MSAEAMMRRDFRGSAVVWRSSGSGDPLLYLRGFDAFFDTAAFECQLAARARVLVPDHPGFGASDTPAWIRGMSDMAYFYLDFLAALDLRDVHLVGAGVGAWIAAEIAVRDHTRLARLSLIGPAGLRANGADFGDPFIRSHGDLERLLFNGERPAGLAAPGADDIDCRLKNSFGLARIAWQPRLASTELQRWIHRLSLPVNLIWGAADRVIPPVHAEAWTSALPQARLAMIDGAGHLPHLEQPAAVADRILRSEVGAL